LYFQRNLTITFNKSDDMRNSTASVNAQFIFVNTGIKSRLRLVFFQFSQQTWFDTTSTLESLKVKVKWMVIKLHPRLLRRVSRRICSAHLFDVTFDNNETKEIQVSYEGKAAGGYSYMS